MSSAKARSGSRSVSASEARRIALRAQGFGGERLALLPPPPAAARAQAPRGAWSGPSTSAIPRSGASPAFGGASTKKLAEAATRLGAVQLDSVNVLCRAHYLPLFARLGPYDRARLDGAAWERPSTLFEYWGHQAALLPVTRQPLFRWRMERARDGIGTWAGIARFGREKEAYVATVLAEIGARGPLVASEITGAERSRGGWWEWTPAKRALEWLFWSGRVMVSTRRNFERLYDLPERVLPASVLALPTPSVEDAHRELVRISSVALGIGTEDDIADYFRLSRRDVRPRLAELIEEGAIVPVEVEGWSKPAYLDARAKVPRAMPPSTRGVLCPFDPLVWYRPRAERLFGFRYRIEIYTPAHKRTHGYYVLPFLLGENLVGRVDLKAERKTDTLAVRAGHAEPGADLDEVAAGLAPELELLASWLGLARVSVARKGRLATALRAALR